MIKQYELIKKELFGLCDLNETKDSITSPISRTSLNKYENKDKYFIMKFQLINGKTDYITIEGTLDELTKEFIILHKDKSKRFRKTQIKDLTSKITDVNEDLYKLEMRLEEINNLM